MRFDSYTQGGTLPSGTPKENQDCSLCGHFTCDTSPDGGFLVVSDGVGSKAYSHIGAQSLCRAVQQTVATESLFLQEGDLPSFLELLHGQWLKNLGKHHGDQCSCTALIAIVLEDMVHLFRLGDGFLAGVWRGDTHIFMEDKERQGKFLNETEGLGSQLDLSRWYFSSYPREGLRGIIACTDGIEIGDQTIFDYEAFSRDFIKTLFPLSAFQGDLQALVESQNNRDDKTVAFLLEEQDHWKETLFSSMTVYDQYNHPHVCTDVLSSGGQGVVYRTQSPHIAVKFVFDAHGDKDWQNLEENQRFLDIRLLPTPAQVTKPSVVLDDYVGYTMELLEDMESFDESFSLRKESYTQGDWFLDQHKSQADLVDLLHNYKRTGGLRRRLLAYYKLSTLFLQLHSRGLVFGDFSPKNVFLSTSRHFSHVWLIDVDNLGDQSQHQKKLGYYTPRFVAPEVAKKERGCSFYSDDYSFALALFLQLTGTHPFSVDPTGEEELEHTLLTLEDFADNLTLQQRDQGEFPWILQESEEGEPSQEDTAIPYPFILPPHLLSLFHRTFTTGKTHRYARASSLEWQAALAMALDSTITCPSCGLDYHYHTHLTLCPWCDHTVPLLKVDSYLQDSPATTPLWTFVQERSHPIALPLRLFPDQKQEESLQSVLGYVEEKGGELLLSKLHSHFQFEVRDKKGSWGKHHRNFALEAKESKEFQLLCQGKEVHYRLEVTLL